MSVIWMYFFADGRVANVWDTHGGIGGLDGITGWSMLAQTTACRRWIRPTPPLLEDLHQRGLLDDTLVVADGRVRPHAAHQSATGPRALGAVLHGAFAGGGVRGGQVYGTSDRIAAYPTDNPRQPGRLLATIYHALGIRPDSEVHDREGRPQCASAMGGRSRASSEMTWRP